MHYHQNLMFCTDSYWYKEAYLCNHMVSFSGYEFEDDWESLIVETETTKNLKPEVLLWLEENVKDSTDKAMKDHPKGWDIGSDEYRSRNFQQISIFFLRRRDAFAFIKRWSKYKKTNYFLQLFQR